MSLLRLDGVQSHFVTGRSLVTRKPTAWVKAVDGVSLSIAEGEVLGLVGESGCGKSTLARTILGLAPLTGGEISWEGRAFTPGARKESLETRLAIQMVFQDPFASLNPRMTVFDLLAEPYRVHRPMPFAELARAVKTLMEQVGLAGRFVRKYPHEFSGGQRQRIAIARALALKPRLLLADEPVSALDVSIQAQILNLLSDLRAEMGLAMLFVSHDLSVVKHVSDRIAVMHRGRVVESGTVAEVMEAPREAYTRELLAAAPGFAGA